MATKTSASTESFDEFIRRLTAFHEAAHAVVSVRLGQPFEYVTIIGEDEAGGHVQYAEGAVITDVEEFDHTDPAHWRRLEIEVTSSFAGAIGELLASRDLPVEAALDLSEMGAEDDDDGIDDLLEDIFSDDEALERFYHEQHQRAIDLIYQPVNLRALAAVAKALLQTPTLTLDAVVAIITSSDERFRRDSPRPAEESSLNSSDLPRRSNAG